MMLFIVFLLSYIACGLTDVQDSLISVNYQLDADDKKAINETFAKYGPPVDYIKLGLPGSEFSSSTFEEIHLLNKNTVISEKPGTYILKTRTATSYFSYNGRFEHATLKTRIVTDTPVVRGQFGEHFQANNETYYLRTIGYELDENGYRQFLIELRRINVRYVRLPPPVVVSENGGGLGTKISISSVVLGTLIGGNSLG